MEKIEDCTRKPAVEVIYYTKTGEISLRHKHRLTNELSSVGKATIGKGLINKGMFPIMGFETQHGFLNLIPSSKTPKLEQLCAKQIAEQAYSIKDLNNLIVPKYCLMLIKMEFIRYHYLRTYGYPDMFLSKVYGE